MDHFLGRSRSPLVDPWADTQSSFAFIRHIQYGHMILLHAFYDLLISNHLHTGVGTLFYDFSTVFTLQDCNFRFSRLRDLLPGPLNRLACLRRTPLSLIATSLHTGLDT